MVPLVYKGEEVWRLGYVDTIPRHRLRMARTPLTLALPFLSALLSRIAQRND